MNFYLSFRCFICFFVASSILRISCGNRALDGLSMAPTKAKPAASWTPTLNIPPSSSAPGYSTAPATPSVSISPSNSPQSSISPSNNIQSSSPTLRAVISHPPSNTPALNTNINSFVPTTPSNILHDQDKYMCIIANQMTSEKKATNFGWKCTNNIPTQSICSSNVSIPNWFGVSCTSNIVTSITFESYVYLSSIPSTVGYLTNLEGLTFKQTNFVGVIPNTIGNLTNLVTLSISDNYFINATIPSSIGYLTQLITLEIFSSCLIGTIPTTIGYLTKLTSLNLNSNSLTGTIPNEISNLISLEDLELNYNSIEGSLPLTMGLLSNLQYLILYDNKFTNTIPTTFMNLVNLQRLHLYDNKFMGSIPIFISKLTKMTLFALNGNSFTGTIPKEIWSMPNLLELSLYQNQLTGTIPYLPISLSNLYYVSFNNNKLYGTIPTSLCQLSYILSYLYLDTNSLTGTIPTCFYLFKNITTLTLNNNKLSGSISKNIKNFQFMQYLYMSTNSFTGSIPTEIGYLVNLRILDLDTNSFTGSIPTTLQSVITLEEMYLRNNKFNGPYDNFFNFKTNNNNNNNNNTQKNNNSNNNNGNNNNVKENNWINIDLSNNQLTGKLDGNIFASLPSLKIFVLTINCINVYVPDGICNAKNLTTLALDGLSTASSCTHAFFDEKTSKAYTLSHTISQTIPSCLYNMPMLNTLHLSGNDLTGTIPSNVTITKTLKDLSLSYNRLSGSIPLSIQNKKWQKLDLSFNMFSGILGNNITIINDGKLSMRINRLSGVVPKTLNQINDINVLEGNIFECNFNTNILPSSDPDKTIYRCGSDSFVLSVYISIGSYICCILYVFYYNFIRKRIQSIFIFIQNFILFWNATDGSHFSKLLKKLRTLTIVLTLYIVFVHVPVYTALSKYYRTHTKVYAWSISASYLDGTVPASILVAIWSFMLVCFLCTYWYVFLRSIQVDERENNHNIATMAAEEEPNQMKPTYVDMAVLLCFVMIDLVVVFVINAGYIYGTLTASSGVVLFLQILLGVFKLVWKGLFIKNIDRFRRNILGIRHNVNHKFGHDVAFLSVILILNNILVPIAAEAAVDSNCIYNIFVPAPSVTASYDYTKCDFIDPAKGCLAYVTVSPAVSYSPPFTYRYQCTSTIVVNYASVFMYMFTAMCCDVPFMFFICYIRKFFQKDQIIHKVLNVIASDLYKDPVKFRLSYVVADMVSGIGMLLTFGAVFPPIAIVVCIAIVMNGCMTMYLIKQQVPDASEVAPHFNLSYISYLIIFSSIFLSFFLFDILGLQYTVWKSLWASIILLVISCGLWLVLRILISYYERMQSNHTNGPDAVLVSVPIGIDRSQDNHEGHHKDNNIVENNNDSYQKKIFTFSSDQERPHYQQKATAQKEDHLMPLAVFEHEISSTRLEEFSPPKAFKHL